MVQSVRAGIAARTFPTPVPGPGERAFQSSSRKPGRGLPNPLAVLVGFVLLALAVTALGTLVAWPSLGGWYEAVRKPPGALSPWMFPACRGPSAVLAAIAAWRVWRAPRRPPRHRALLLWGWTLFFGATWCVWLFALQRPWPATALALFSVLLSGLATRDFAQVDRPAGFLMAPSLGWVCYATWLTAGIAWLNG